MRVKVLSNLTLPSVTITSPSSGAILTSGIVSNILWSPSGVGYDKYQIVVGNTVINTERQLYDRVSTIDTLLASYTSFPWNVPNLLTDFTSGTAYTPDQIKNSFYLQIKMIKNDSAGGGIIALSNKVPFSVSN